MNCENCKTKNCDRIIRKNEVVILCEKSSNEE